MLIITLIPYQSFKVPLKFQISGNYWKPQSRLALSLELLLSVMSIWNWADLVPSQMGRSLWAHVVPTVRSKNSISVLIKHELNIRAHPEVREAQLWIGWAVFWWWLKRMCDSICLEAQPGICSRRAVLDRDISQLSVCPLHSRFNSSSRKRNWTFIWGKGFGQWVLSQKIPNPGRTLLFPPSLIRIKP